MIAKLTTNVLRLRMETIRGRDQRKENAIVNPWNTWLNILPQSSTASDTDAKFDTLARQLMGPSRLMIGGEPHRIVELEFYLNSPHHPDPFTHCDPLQQEFGRWYFHRSGGTYRNGSFKGFDLTFGTPESYAGILVRSLDTPEGQLINGPSLCVDHLLRKTGAGHVAELDRTLGGRRVWDTESPIHLSVIEDQTPTELFATARVGLSLKRNVDEVAKRFVLKRYRFLSEPRRIAKGRIYLVLALHAQGLAEPEISQITGSPPRSVARWVEQFENGRATDFSEFLGANLDSLALCRLHGALESSRLEAEASVPKGASV